VRTYPRSASHHHFAAADLQARWSAHEGEDTREIEALAPSRPPAPPTTRS